MNDSKIPFINKLNQFDYYFYYYGGITEVLSSLLY